MKQLALGNNDQIIPDREHQIVERLIGAANTTGFQVDPVTVTNLYVGLKSKPLTLLIGPSNTGKIAAVQTVAKELMGYDPLRCQMMAGHSWWANQTDDVVRFTQAQVCWNSGKIVDLIQEAGQPENAHRMYLACLARISPAELNEFFSEVAFQLRHGEVMRVGSVHLSEPISFPKNMFLIGTMDGSQTIGPDEDLLLKTSFVYWSPNHSQSMGQLAGNEFPANREGPFLRSCLRSVQAAFQKLCAILKNQRQAFFPLFQTSRVFQKHGIWMPNSTIHSAMVYLANSWSGRGIGLFNQDTSTNLEIALDLSITQTFLLPIEDQLMESSVFRKDLLSVLGERFPRSRAFVRDLG